MSRSDAVARDDAQLGAVLEEHIARRLRHRHTHTVVSDHRARLVIHTELKSAVQQTTATGRDLSTRDQQQDSGMYSCVSSASAMTFQYAPEPLTSLAAYCTTAEKGAFSGTVTLRKRSSNSRSVQQQVSTASKPATQALTAVCRSCARTP